MKVTTEACPRVPQQRDQVGAQAQGHGHQVRIHPVAGARVKAAAAEAGGLARWSG